MTSMRSSSSISKMLICGSGSGRRQTGNTTREKSIEESQAEFKRVLAKTSIFGENFDFWIKFLFLGKI